GQIRKGRDGAHRRGSVRDLYGGGRRRERRSRDFEGDGHDFRAFDTGGIGIWSGGESRVAVSVETRLAASRRRKTGQAPSLREFKAGTERHHGKESYRVGKVADCGGQGHAGASGGTGAG